MSIAETIKKIICYKNLSDQEMSASLHAIMSGSASPSQIAGFLVAMEMKGPTLEELTTAARIMRELSVPITIKKQPLIDIVGTGGDGASTFNISTTATFLVAAAGGYVAKHGNRSVSSSSGSADVLEQAGVNLDLSLEKVQCCIEQIGLGFLFAPNFHPALKYAVLPRKELGIRTFFNLLGPLTNPANARHLVVGVFDKKWLLLVAKVLQNLGCCHALVVHSQDGLDEISLSAPTFVVEVKGATLEQYEVTPEALGLVTQPIDSLKVTSATESLTLMEQVLQNQQGPGLDIVLMNAGAAIYVAGLANSLFAGIEKAREVVASGGAFEKLQQLIAFSKN